MDPIDSALNKLNTVCKSALCVSAVKRETPQKSRSINFRTPDKRGNLKL